MFYISSLELLVTLVVFFGIWVNSLLSIKLLIFFFFSSRRRHTRFLPVSWARFIRDTPHAPHIATARIYLEASVRFSADAAILFAFAVERYRIFIAVERWSGIRFELLLEIVSLRLGKEEHLLEVHRKTIPHGGGHTGGLVPNDLVAQHPAAQDHFVSELVRNIAERLGWNTVTHRIDLDVYKAIAVLRILAPLGILSAVVFLRFCSSVCLKNIWRGEAGVNLIVPLVL